MLVDRLRRLYGETPDFDTWFDALIESVARLYAARSNELRALDAERVASPNWFLSEKMLGYSAYVDRFAGTLAGVAQRIPHLRELGVNYLHLLPFLRARSGDNDGGFAVASYDEIEPRLGTMADLEALATTLRAARISLCADLVLNHVADDHPWAAGARAGDARLRKYFHVFPDRALPERYESTLGQIFPDAAPGNFTHVPAAGGWVWTTFYPYQWDLNYSNPEVFGAMAASLLSLANRGIEVFRLDSAAFLWKRLRTPCMNQPEAHWILEALRCLVQIVAPGVLLKAEAIVPTRELPPYFGLNEARGRECHLAYQSSLMAAAWVAVAEQNTEILRQVIEATPPLPACGSWITYVRCHDDIGWNVLRLEAQRADENVLARLENVSRFFAGEGGSFSSGAAFQTHGDIAVHGTNGMAAALAGFERAEIDAQTRDAQTRDAHARMALLYGLAFCFGGLPIIYMGDEIALGNDYSDRSQSARAIDGRWLQRPWFDDERFAQRVDTDSVAGRAYSDIRRLVVARQRMADLAADSPAVLLAVDNPALLALERGSRFLALANFSASPVTVALKKFPRHPTTARWIDCLSHARVSDEIALDAWGMAWLEAEVDGPSDIA